MPGPWETQTSTSRHLGLMGGWAEGHTQSCRVGSTGPEELPQPPGHWPARRKELEGRGSWGVQDAAHPFQGDLDPAHPHTLLTGDNGSPDVCIRALVSGS